METNSIPRKGESYSSFKRSARLKKNRSFFGEEASENHHANQKKTKSTLTTKGKASKKVLLPGGIAEESLQLSEKKSRDGMDDEDLWLDALEKGELDDNGEIPKARDLTLMTARQRALLDRSSSTLVEEITTPSKEETEEERKKRLEKNRQRKIQAVKKAKETQKQTIRKLVEIPKTSKEKQRNSQNAFNSNKPASPMIKYVNNAASCTISYPDGLEYPLIKTKPLLPKDPRFCLICGEKRRYSCSKTNVSLCSLKCYKENFKRSEVIT